MGHLVGRSPRCHLQRLSQLSPRSRSSQNHGTTGGTSQSPLHGHGVRARVQ
jgi:hypothetical protein